MNSLPCKPGQAAVLAALLAWLAPRAARAEDSISYKFEYYREMGGRIAVDTHGAYIEKDLGTDTKVKLEGIIDSIAGATPNGQPARTGSDQVRLSPMHERRKAWSGNIAHQFKRINVALGAANSRESDYVSTGWSVNTITDFNQKNTTLLVGVAGTDDKIKVFYQIPRAAKETNDVILGVTQLLDPQTALSFNITFGRQRGYLADPYKIVQKNVEILSGIFLPLTFGESRPAERDKWIGLVTYNRSFPEARGALDASYRFYRDSFDTFAHTVDLAWFQRAGAKLILRPGVRFYDQSAAYFYHYSLDDTTVAPFSGPPRRNGPFYSSDYRLSAMQTFTYGLKVIFNATPALSFDAAYERYDMRGSDHVTPQSAYCRANIVTLGAKFSW
ncbi:MAG TPA: DUF3570 domain-containing protein [Opitutaceae bacterium]|nr:DUF3570 domain-containing protein [Opitutaceae bacterium]